MKKIKDNLIDVIFADPPYFLSNGGKSIHSGKVVSVNKGKWDKKENYSSTLIFTKNWISECKRILKKDGTIWITGTKHNIFEIKSVLEELGLEIINIVIWNKLDPPPLIYKNKFRFSYEFVIWVKKSRTYNFNYDEMFKEAGMEMTDVWRMPAVSMSEKHFGYHPTQKPECLLRRIIMASTLPNQIILDPFMGSGTTCAVAKKLCRQYIGIEIEKKYYDIACKRIQYI